MKKIGIAGLQREQIKAQIEQAAPGEFECHILNDMDAAMKVKAGVLDYYIGCCNTGAGAALSIAIAIIGYPKVALLLNLPSKLSPKRWRSLFKRARWRLVFQWNMSNMPFLY